MSNSAEQPQATGKSDILKGILTPEETIRAQQLEQQRKTGQIDNGAFSVSAKTMGELREEAPDLYAKMIKSLVQNMIHQMSGHQDRMKRARNG